MRPFAFTRARHGIAMLALAAGCATAAVENQTSTFSPIVIGGNLPYKLSLKVLNMGGAASVPTLQSYAAARHGSEWVILAGRTNGLHNFTNDGFQNFPPAFQNTTIWVIDVAKKQTWSRSLNDPSSGLTTQQVDSLSATNTAFAQLEDRLYVAGGYVYDRAADNFVTYDTLTALDLEGVVDWVKNGTGKLIDHIRQTSDPILKVAGGEMRFLGNRALLVFGQDFEGPYLATSNGDYTMAVRGFNISDDGATLAIENISASTPAPEYRRRDLNVVPMLAHSGTIQGLIALSGVFMPGDNGGAWTVPVEIDAEGSPTMADPALPGTFKQGMNTYRSATISLFSRKRDETHAIALGGISLEYFDTATRAIAYDENIPFINGITSIVRDESGRYTQYYLGEYPDVPNPSNGNAPFLFGADANFFPAADVPHYDNGMLKLDLIIQPTVIGYVYGGIIAQIPNFGATGASNLIFEVTLTPVFAPEFQIFGEDRRTTRARSLVLKGRAAQSTDTIQWRVAGRGGGYRSQHVDAKGNWQIRVGHLERGKTKVRLRGVNLNGVVSAPKPVTIIRK